MHSTVARRAWVFAGALGLSALVPAAAAHAQVNVAAGKPVIAGSGSWNGNPFNSGGFNALQVTDGVGDADGDNNSGPINEPTQTGFWLGNEMAPNQFFVLDLQSPVNIGRVDLFNTHNAQFNDRGTRAFTLDASNDPNFGSFTTIASGTLAQTFIADDPIEGESFAANTGGQSFQYLRFTAVDFYSAGGFGSSGLNEIRVYEVPEPAGFALLALTAGGLFIRRRRPPA